MRWAIGCVACVGLLTACGTLLPHAPTRGHAASGFLSSYGNLAPSTDRHDVLFWRLPGDDFADFDAVVVEQPVMRRRLDDTLPSPTERDELCLALRSAVERAVQPRFKVLQDDDAASRERHRIFRVKLAVTTALIDNGHEPPEPDWQRWSSHPGRFALECEAVWADNARPMAKMVVFDRDRLVQPDAVTPWSECRTLFDAWAADVAWLLQPPVTTGPAESSPVSGERSVPEVPVDGPATADSSEVST
ncbi:MAG: hypothetical protein RLZZ558_547 [Planctomycetota bacterium]|jgi:hypothetical protein